MKKTIISFVITFFILIVLIFVTVCLAVCVSNKNPDFLIEQKENLNECLDLKEQVTVAEKNIETNFFWSKTYVIVCLSSDGEKRHKFTVSNDTYYNLPIGMRLLYCEKCNRIFETIDN